MFEQEYHTLCLGDEMPEISFHSESSSLLLPEDDFTTNPYCPFKTWSLDDTLEKELNSSQSCLPPQRITLDNDVAEQQPFCKRDNSDGKVNSDQENGMLSELHMAETLNMKDRKEFICPVCNKNAISFAKLFSHMQIHSGRSQCSICDKIFPNRSHLCLHIQRHMKIRSYHCQECTFSSTDKHDLILHIRRHRNERKFECMFCKKKFFRRVELNYHKKCVHLHNEIKQCKLCKFSTYSRNILNYHNINRHQMEKIFQCHKCQVVFKHKHSLVIHMRTHTGEKPFSCSKCKKAFKSRSELTSHFKLHNMPSISCTLCKRKFSRKSNLLQHMTVHTKEKTYSCNMCSYESSWKSTLRRHIKTIHKTSNSNIKKLHQENEKKMEQDFLQNSTESSSVNDKTKVSMFEEHISNQNILNFCSNNKAYLKHQLHSCVECHKMFKRKNELNSHMYVHKVKSFECKVCSRKFKTKSNLNRHSYCHTGLKPYTCKFCPYASNLKTSVIRHISSQHNKQNLV